MCRTRRGSPRLPPSPLHLSPLTTSPPVVPQSCWPPSQQHFYLRRLCLQLPSFSILCALPRGPGFVPYNDPQPSKTLTKPPISQSFNSLGQSPCAVAAHLQGVCDQGGMCTSPRLISLGPAVNRSESMGANILYDSVHDPAIGLWRLLYRAEWF